MREKIYFIISSIIGIINIIYLNFFNVEKLTNINMPDVGGEFGERVAYLLSNPRFYCILGIIDIIIFIFLIIISLKNKLPNYRRSIVGASILLLLSATNSILFLIPVINLLMTRNIPEIEKEKKEMPILEKKKTDKGEFIKSIMLIIVYFFINFGLGKIVHFFVRDISFTFTIIFNIVTDLILVSLTIGLFYREFIEGLKILFKNIQGYRPFIFKRYGILLLANVGVTLIISLFKGSLATSQNEVSLNSLPMWYLFPAAVIYAPIVEEFVFRGCLRKIINNDKVFIIASGIAFGLLHTIGQEASILNTIIYALPYMAMGMVLANTYVKSNNITTNIAIHSLNNLLGCLVKLI